MDSFSEPYTRVGDDVSIGEVRSQIKLLEDDHRTKGITLSGRVIHACHYLPITASLPSRAGVPSPPPTPPSKVSEVPTSPTETAAPSAAAPTTSEPAAVWNLSPRYGHAAMISGIRALSVTHEQLVIGWTGDIETTVPGEKVPTSTISDADKNALEEAMSTYTPREADPDDDKKTTYLPVWQDDKVAHGHYDGYCKASEFWLLLLFSAVFLPNRPLLWDPSHFALPQLPPFRHALHFLPMRCQCPFFKCDNLVHQIFRHLRMFGPTAQRDN